MRSRFVLLLLLRPTTSGFTTVTRRVAQRPVGPKMAKRMTRRKRQSLVTSSRTQNSLVRTPPLGVRKQLRQEVGFACPDMLGSEHCGSPYLQWHHFDPEWHEEHHHRVKDMIALCAPHHDKAGVGAFTKDQLREFKARGAERALEVRGRFDWMRRQLLAVVGGMAVLDCPTIVQIGDHPIILGKA